MSAELFNEQIARLNKLSERVFGDAADMERTEAEELLRTVGIDPEALKDTLYQRMRERSETYVNAGQSLPPLLRQALEDLRPSSEQSVEETTVARTARRTVARLMKEIRELPKLLDAGFTPAFTATYRVKEELSARDKKVLDGIADDLRKRIGDRKTKP